LAPAAAYQKKIKGEHGQKEHGENRGGENVKKR
jgi:hypothetical protein